MNKTSFSQSSERITQQSLNRSGKPLEIMAEKAQARVQDSVNDLMQDVDKSVLRKMQGDMHRCAATCCDKTTYGMDDVHRCIERCSVGMQKSQEYIQKELGDFQNRLERCVLQCQDNIKDKITANTTEAQIDGFKAEFETCAVKCADSHIDILHGIRNRMINTLSEIKKS